MRRPQRVLEERLKDINLLHAVGVDGVHEVGVVHHDARGLLRERVARVVDDVDQPCVREIFDVVHHRGAARLDVYGQLAHVGRRGAVHGQQVEQLLQLGQVLQLDLLDEKNVHLNHHIHRLEQVLREIAALEEEGVEAVVEVALEDRQGVHHVEHLVGYALVVAQDFLQRVGREVAARLEVKEFAERESAQVVAVYEAVELGVLVLQAHHAGACEHDSQPRVLVVAAAQLLAPVGLLEHLVDEQHLAAQGAELAREVGQALALEVEIIHVDVQAFAAAHIKMFLGVLQQERRLSDAACALDANHRASPVDLVHELAVHGQVDMVHQISVSPKECFHI